MKGENQEKKERDVNNEKREKVKEAILILILLR